MLLTITDETFSGTITNELNIEFSQSEITVKDLIEQRVLQEVDKYNKRVLDKFNGLIQPTEKEIILNERPNKEFRMIDGEQQVYVALDAFQKNGFFILIEQKQAETLEERILLRPNMSVSFIKLVPLVGG